jgi:hypothetical protein
VTIDHLEMEVETTPETLYVSNIPQATDKELHWAETFLGSQLLKKFPAFYGTRKFITFST